MITIDWIINNLDFFGNGIDQTNILICLCLADTALGVSVKLYNHQKLHSQKFLAGIIHNFFPSLIPALLTLCEIITRHFLPIYSLVSVCLFVFIAYFLIQSILANAVLLGLDVDWIKKWLEKELDEKTGGKDNGFKNY